MFVYEGIEGGFRGYFRSVLGALFSSFGCFTLEIWVLRFRVLGASFSDFRVLCFRDLGASFSRFGCSVLEI